MFDKVLSYLPLIKTVGIKYVQLIADGNKIKIFEVKNFKKQIYIKKERLQRKLIGKNEAIFTAHNSSYFKQIREAQFIRIKKTILIIRLMYLFQTSENWRLRWNTFNFFR